MKTEELSVDYNKNLSNIANSSNSIPTLDVDDFNTEDDEEGRNLLSSHCKITLNWTNLSYAVSEFKCFPSSLRDKKFFQRKEKLILHPQSGQLKNGCLTALIGKSGSGKSTLIESLTGRRKKGLKGEITVKIHSKLAFFIDERRIKIAFIPQADVLLNTLTVFESLLFASKLKNNELRSKQHQKIIDQLLIDLDLNSCKNSRVLRCSGGERKRLSIAMELVSKPTILVLDEPTSGLDSASAFQCVNLLRKLTESKSNPIAILVSIHQPSAKLLDIFHNMYLLSYDGRCLYNGPVDELLSFFNKFNVPCPQYHNPADHALEVASGEQGYEIVDQMSEELIKSNISLKKYEDNTEYPVSSIINSMCNHSIKSLISHCSTLTLRTLKCTFRDPILNYARLFKHVLVPILLILLYGQKVGEESGCLADSGNDSLASFSLERFKNVQIIIFYNVGLITFSMLFVIFSSIMPIVLVFPIEMNVFVRERTNGWYSCLSYYLAKNIADFPFLLLFTSLYTALVYYPTGQINEDWRFACYLLICVLMAFIGQSIGMMIGTIFVKNLLAAAFLAPLSILPFILFSGFFLKISDISDYLQIICLLSSTRYGFEALTVVVYGFNRCDHSIIKYNETINDVIFKFANYLSSLDLTYSAARPILQALTVDKNVSLSELDSFDVHFKNFSMTQFNLMDFNRHESLAIQLYDLKDEYFLTNTIILIISVFILKIISYILLLFQANNRN